MRRIVLASLLALLVSSANAQHRGGFRPGFARSGPNGGAVRRGQFRGNGVRGFGYGYGNAFAPYYAGTPYYYPPQPNFSVFQPPLPPPVFVEQPPREAQSVIHEYVQPVTGTSTSTQGEPPAFGIVLKDGSMRSASAVFVANNVLHYVDTEERNMRISMDEVDREATRKLNREKKLNLWLPAATPSSR
jgi:hypothetical protein